MLRKSNQINFRIDEKMRKFHKILILNFNLFQMVKLGSSAGVGAGVDLKDSEEVAEYIDNLGIEYRFVC